ncbi:uroporphyrinogen-III synthase [Embleya scabrispora]|uniref:uroporphyrinogen-III synthase n=1 Tax=Embleya scabrispora TaxID=159449 RepID=UPI00037BF692|nr:uroporphyrinogen-III synthase [Embleya scabrispora]MYS80304.1 uroporphyrinogen-III synthase [Streptomyces sp. SID5474]
METGTGAEPLIGFTIGVTAARRREELVGLLRDLGAKVVDAPTVRIVPPADDPILRRATDRALERRLDYVVATTGVGWRGWFAAAESWGRGARLTAACRAAVLVCRGPKAGTAVRACGLREVYSPGSDAGDEVLAWLLARDLRGRRIAVQEHGAPLAGFADTLRGRGADVLEIPVYRWGPPDDPSAVRRLVEQTVRRELHALTFTNAPAIGAFLETAEEHGRGAEVLAALRADVLPVCIGPVCARPLAEQGVESVWPERGRLGSLVRTIAEALPARARRELHIGTERLVLQGNALLVDGRTIWLPPVPGAVLRALAEKPGWVLSRAELLRRVWADTRTDEHAVEAAVARLRTALGPYAGLVRTVTKRGYRLAVDP